MSSDGVHLVERRRTDRYCSGPTTCGDAAPALSDTIRALDDCAVLLCSRIGFEPWRPLEEAGIQPNSEHANETIDAALAAVYREWRDSGRLDVEDTALSRSSA